MLINTKMVKQLIEVTINFVIEFTVEDNNVDTLANNDDKLIYARMMGDL